MDPVTTTIDSVFSKCLGQSYKLTDLSIDATANLAVIGSEKGLYIVKLEQPEEDIVIKKTKLEVSKLECNPHICSAQYVASTTAGQLILWDISAERSVMSTTPAHSRVISELSWSRHNPSLLATGSPDSNICLWDTRTPKAPSRITSYNAYSFCPAQVEFHPTQENIIATSHGGYVRIWDTRNTTSAQIAMFPAHKSDITSIHWATGKSGALLTGSQDKYVKFWNLPPYINNPQCGSTTHTGFPVSCVRFVPNSSRYLLTSHYSNNAIYLWAAGDLTPQGSLNSGSEPPISFDWRCAGSERFVVSISKDFCLRMWSLPNMDDSTPTTPRRNKMQSCDFSPLAIDHELARIKQNLVPGFYVHGIDNIKRSCIISFTTVAHGKFELQVMLPTMYPHNATPSFEFVTTPNLLSHSVNQTKVDIKEQLDEVAAEHVTRHKPCLGACIEALSTWVDKNLGELVMTEPPPSPLVRSGRHKSKSSPPVPLPAITPIVSPFASPPNSTLQRSAFPILPAPPAKAPTGCVVGSHTVTDAQTLMGIAIAYDMAPSVLKKINRLYSNLVIPGQQLWVFKKAGDATSEVTLEPETKPTSTTTEIEERASKPPLPPVPQFPFQPKTRSQAIPRGTKDIQLLLQPTLAETQVPAISVSLTASSFLSQEKTTRYSWGKNRVPPSLGDDVMKEKLECWSPSFFVCGELTLTRQLLVFEPSTDDPFVIRGGVVQFQLCVELAEICSVKFFRSPNDWARRVGAQTSDSSLTSSVGDEFESINKMRFPCIEVSMLVGKVLQTRQFRDLPEAKLEALCTSIKKWVVESYKEATENGKAHNYKQTPAHTPAHSPASSLTNSVLGVIPTSPALRAQNSFSIRRSSSLLRLSAALEDSSMPELSGSTELLVDHTRVKNLRSVLPRRLQATDWQMLFCTVHDGFSLRTFYTKVKNTSPSLILIEDSQGHVFGALVTEQWDPEREGYYGNGETVLFKLYPEFRIYRWTKQNNFFMYSKPTALGLGGGRSGFGLWIDEDLDNGCSNSCSTFDNECIASAPDFKCTVLEAWGFCT